MATQITNLPDDLERKVLHFGIFEATNSFAYEILQQSSILSIMDYMDMPGFIVRPIEGDTAINCRFPRTKAGIYTENQFNFTIQIAEDGDIKALEQFNAKKVVLFVVTSTYNYIFGTSAEPLTYSYNQNTSSVQVSVAGNTRTRPLRVKI